MSSNSEEYRPAQPPARLALIAGLISCLCVLGLVLNWFEMLIPISGFGMLAIGAGFTALVRSQTSRGARIGLAVVGVVLGVLGVVVVVLAIIVIANAGE